MQPIADIRASGIERTMFWVGFTARVAILNAAGEIGRTVARDLDRLKALVAHYQ